jgi:hypothetical protein
MTVLAVEPAAAFARRADTIRPSFCVGKQSLKRAAMQRSPDRRQNIDFAAETAEGRPAGSNRNQILAEMRTI